LAVDWLQRILQGVPVLLSLSVHEWAHARAAWALGDDTAAREGRLSLNPFVHLDWLGSLLPFLGIPFGWAKPVPVNPMRFTRPITMAKGRMLTAAAGPLSNLLLALLTTGLLLVLRVAAPEWLSYAGNTRMLLTHTLVVNLSLATFNLLPFFPLDGSRIVDGIVPYRWRFLWEKFGLVSPFLLLFIVLGLPFLGVDPFAWLRTLTHVVLSFALGID
jgi:Zn-dependent protease